LVGASTKKANKPVIDRIRDRIAGINVPKINAPRDQCPWDEYP